MEISINVKRKLIVIGKPGLRVQLTVTKPYDFSFRVYKNGYKTFIHGTGNLCLNNKKVAISSVSDDELADPACFGINKYSDVLKQLPAFFSKLQNSDFCQNIYKHETRGDKTPII